jgi:hypothetical protein
MSTKITFVVNNHSKFDIIQPPSNYLTLLSRIKLHCAVKEPVLYYTKLDQHSATISSQTDYTHFLQTFSQLHRVIYVFEMDTPSVGVSMILQEHTERDFRNSSVKSDTLLDLAETAASKFTDTVSSSSSKVEEEVKLQQSVNTFQSHDFGGAASHASNCFEWSDNSVDKSNKSKEVCRQSSETSSEPREISREPRRHNSEPYEAISHPNEVSSALIKRSSEVSSESYKASRMPHLRTSGGSPTKVVIDLFPLSSIRQRSRSGSMSRSSLSFLKSSTSSQNSNFKPFDVVEEKKLPEAFKPPDILSSNCMECMAFANGAVFLCQECEYQLCKTCIDFSRHPHVFMKQRLSPSREVP